MLCKWQACNSYWNNLTAYDSFTQPAALSHLPHDLTVKLLHTQSKAHSLLSVEPTYSSSSFSKPNSSSSRRGGAVVDRQQVNQDYDLGGSSSNNSSSEDVHSTLSRSRTTPGQWSSLRSPNSHHISTQGSPRRQQQQQQQQRYSSNGSLSDGWRQRYSISDQEFDPEAALFGRPVQSLRWKEIAHLLVVNAKMFWPTYLYPARNRRRVTPERRRRLLFSYAPDWIITVGLWIGIYFIDKVDGFRREFSITDTSLQHTYTIHERVPVWSLALICLAPIVFYAFIGLYIMKSFWDFHAAILGEVLALALTISVTTVVKVLVGRPRPDVIDRCQPENGASNGIPYGLVTSAICTTTNLSRLQEGFRSFPSGHASTAWAGLGFFGLYLCGKLHLFDQRGHTIKAWIAIVPFTGAGLISLTRVTDYRHHATDIIAGSLLGIVLAWFSYRLYYPPLMHEFAHKAYAPRIPEDEDPAFDEHDEEVRNPAAGNGVEGPEGTLKRPVEGRGQGPIGLQAPNPARGATASSSGGRNGRYEDLEMGD